MTAQTLQQRAEIERAAGSRTLCDLLDHTAAEAGDAPAFSNEAGDSWQTLSWAQARQQVRELAAGFAAPGLAPGAPDRRDLPTRAEEQPVELAARPARDLARDNPEVSVRSRNTIVAARSAGLACATSLKPD